MSYFNQFKKEVPGSDGYAHTWQKSKDDIEHDTLLSAIRQEIGFCGCGDPDSALEYVYHALKWVDAMRTYLDGMETTKGNDAEWSKLWEDEEKRFGSRGAMYFMWYWLDEQKLTEHGGSVPGWLTEKGKGIMEDIKEALEL